MKMAILQQQPENRLIENANCEGILPTQRH